MFYNFNLESIYAFWKETEHFRSDYKFQGFVIFKDNFPAWKFSEIFLSQSEKNKKTGRGAKSQFLKNWNFDLGNTRYYCSFQDVWNDVEQRIELKPF